MNRILFEPGEIGQDGRITFGGVRAAHVADVLHGEPGQTIKTGVIGGAVGVSTIERLEGEGDSLRVTALASHDTPPLMPWCDMLLAMPRPRVFKRLLPQLAAMADTHFCVEKGEENGRTFTRVQELDRDGRARELARLTGGESVSETMLRGAEELLSGAEAFKKTLTGGKR